MTDTGPTLSLRSRKRARTWTAIHSAAADAALTHDRLADVTIESIVAEANVSARTFFNYFASKEDAVLGLRAPAIDDRTAAQFVLREGDDAVEKVTRLLFDVLQSSGPSSEQRERNAELTCRHPELVRRRIAHVDAAQSLVSDLVAEKLAGSDPVTDVVGTREAAQMLVLSAGAIIRFAMRSSITEPGADTEALVDRALTVFRDVTGR
ncbi:TetR/AcrR family transcriptional regulator [Rhodococcus phenolicus]|uniref:TetR/AcrR family transcriptional regulator n=1 Tax=Rhodococcus phenolicus TaxID=263849 RepID=UPI00082B7AF4|nr:TetR/AcrR family transcriptional regulator [Rhodococcus phenolicus]